MDEDVSTAGQRASIADAIHERISFSASRESAPGCTVGDLLELEDRHNESVAEGILSLIEEGRVFVPVPLELMDLDTMVIPVTYEVGKNTAEDIQAAFGAQHREECTATGRQFTYDLYVEDIDEPYYPAPPEPYDVREAANEDRPSSCTFPFSAIWPPEALQAIFQFDRAGVLSAVRFAVGARAT